MARLWHSGTGSGGLDRVLLLASSTLLPAGLVTIGLGWYGAAHTPYVFEQIPYLISGGLFGLALVVGASVCYIGCWVTRNAREQLAAEDRTRALLAEIRDRLAEVESQRLAPVRRPGLVATASGSMLHRPDCVVVLSRRDVRGVAEDAPGLSPCRLCNPLSVLS
jgi:hypothetical protein